MANNNNILEIKERIVASKKHYKLLVEYFIWKYEQILEVIVNNNDHSKDDLLKGEARAYKSIIDLLK